MRMSFICDVRLVALAAWLAPGSAAGAGPLRADADQLGRPHVPPVPDEEALHRLVGILDYVAADYPVAVADGVVVDDFEHKEQLAFGDAALEIVRSLGDAAPPGLAGEMEAIQALVRDRADAGRVRGASVAARRRIVDAFGLALSPAAPPSRDDGERLFRTHCAVCHGLAGAPPPEKVAELKPPPRRLSDRGVLGALSPYRAFNALTFGIEGTAMASFASLPSSDRWDLAFHVLTLRDRPGPVPGAVPRGVSTTLAALAAASDDDLRARLRPATSPEVAESALDALRLHFPYLPAAAQAPIAVARRRVDRAMAAADEGRRDLARSLLVDAYLLGFERGEAALRAADSALVAATEAAFLDLRDAVAGTDGARTARSAAELRRLLARAEVRLESGPAGPWVGAFAAALLILREGAEAALLVLLLLAGVAGVGRADAARYVHAGWLAALAAGFLTFAAARVAAARLAFQAELIEAVSALLAAVVLFFVSHWLLGQVQSARWLAFLKERVRAHLSAGRLAALFGLAFLAVYREAVETVLFFEGLLAGPTSAGHVTLGALAGGAALGLLVFGLRRLGSRLPLRAFFAASSALLYALCVVFAGKGVHALVAAGLLAPRPVAFPSLPAVGLFPDGVGLAVQGLLVVLVAASVAALRRRGPSPEAAEVPGGPLTPAPRGR